jgi:Uma2 family endonuclease
MAVALRRLYTREDYLSLEESSAEKHEYYDGNIYLMAGGSVNHARIAGNVLLHLNTVLRGKPAGTEPCEAFNSDLKLLVRAHNLYTYPDGMVVCGRLQLAPRRNDVITNPTVIVEVLSPSTQMYDRTQKFEFYKAIPTFQAYLLIHQDQVKVDYYHKAANGQWLLTELHDLTASLTLHAINLELPLHAIYERVD